MWNGNHQFLRATQQVQASESVEIDTAEKERERVSTVAQLIHRTQNSILNYV